MFPNIENFARQTLTEYVASGFVLNKLGYTGLSSEENPNKNLDRCIGVISRCKHFRCVVHVNRTTGDNSM